MNIDTDKSFWVFGYGSLIWRPGFEYMHKQKAQLYGAHRCLCVYSHHYRGTQVNPGLVFGLLQGGSCHGMAFKIAENNWQSVIAYLRKREQVSNVYCETYRQIYLDTGEQVRALTYVANINHEQFAGRLEIKEQIKLVLTAKGEMGSNMDYVINTNQHLHEMGIIDKRLKLLSHKLETAKFN